MKLFLISVTVFFTFILDSNTESLAKKIESHYKVEFGAINLGSLNWTINIDESSYLTSIALKDKGVFSALYNFSGKYSSEGKIINGEFVSLMYKQSWKTKKKTKNVEILFNNTMVSNLNLWPKEKELARIDYLEVGGLIDPISSMLNIIKNSKNNFKTIDGRRIYKMSLDFNKSKNNIITKKIYIKDYFNIWADHKRNDLEFIIINQNLSQGEEFFPKNIRIKNKGLTFKLTKI